MNQIFLLMFDYSEEDHGLLAVYSNRSAAEEALSYALSLGKFGNVCIVPIVPFDRFFKTDF